MDSDAPGDDHVEERLAEFFDALAHPMRLRILGLISNAEEPLNATTIAHRLDVSDTLASHHLQQLKACGAVAVEERGREKLHELGAAEIPGILTLAYAQLEDVDPPLSPEELLADS